MSTIAAMGIKRGTGKTSLVYHLAWMYAEMGLRVLAVDLDPQANLTTAFLSQARLKELWDDPHAGGTVYGTMRPLMDGGDIRPAPPERISENLSLLPAHYGLSALEAELGASWVFTVPVTRRALLAVTAILRMIAAASDKERPDVVLLDLAPSLSALNRTALAAADHLVFPLDADRYTALGLQVMGPVLRRWRTEWSDLSARHVEIARPCPHMCPAGYVLRSDRSRLEYRQQSQGEIRDGIAKAFHESILGNSGAVGADPLNEDPYFLGAMNAYHSIMALAYEVGKPVFQLTASDGAIGSLSRAVHSFRSDIRTISRSVARRCGLQLPD